MATLEWQLYLGNPNKNSCLKGDFKMKKMITMMVTAALALSMLAGCGSNKITGSFSTDGSTSM